MPRRKTPTRDNALTLVLQQLHAAGAISRQQIVESTGLTRAAVAEKSTQLIELGLAREGGVISTGLRGRPSSVIEVASDGPVVAAAVVEVQSLTVALVSLAGRIERQLKIGARLAEMTPEATAERLRDLLLALYEEVPQSRRIPFVGLAVAGVVEPEGDLISVAPNIGWRDVPMRQILRDALGAEFSVTLANDAGVAALAEFRRGAGRGASSLFSLFGEEGVGGGLVVEGEPFFGGRGFAGEVGHMPVEIVGKPCECGSTGCWQTLIGPAAILAASEAHYSGRSAPLTLAQLVGDADAGDEAALRTLEDTGRALGVGLAAVASVMNPDRIVLAGYFADVFPYVQASATAEFARRALAPIAASVSVRRAMLGDSALVLGVSELAWSAAFAGIGDLTPITAAS